MRAKTLTALVLVLVLATTLAACGGDDEGGDTTTTTAAETTTTTAAETTTTSEATTTTTEAMGWTYTGADGVETTITDTSRIVTLAGDLTEIVFELGLGDNVVGVDVTTTYPPEAAALNERGDTVGFAQQLQAEAVLRFAPTVVIGDTMVQPDSAIEQLRSAGVPVVILETQTTLEGVGTKIEQVAEILNVPDEGDALAERVMGEIEAAQALIPEDAEPPVVAFLYTRGPQVVLIFGRGMQTNAMIEGAGAVDAAAASGINGAVPLTPEALVAAAPDVIVLPESGVEGLGGLDGVLALPGVADTPAGQNDDFLVYDEAYFFNLGPRAGQALDEFVRDLYGIDG
jgi:iron complex transport system substrate-binding protein